MSAGKFFNFQLCLLAMPIPEKDRLQTIVSYSLERAGTAAEIAPDRINEYVAGKEIGYKATNAQHRAIVRGAIVCGVEVGRVGASASRSDEAKIYIRDHEAKHGTDPLVFVSTALFWGCHNNDDPSFRDFSTLCAINSIIGFKKFPVLVRRSMIVARQLGFKTPQVMATESNLRSDLRPLTVQQLRDTLDRLESADFIRRCRASRRCVYFSTTMTRDELYASVKKAAATKSEIKAHRQREKELLATTQQPLRNHLKRKSPKGQEKEPLKKEEPLSNHNTTTGGTTQGTTGGTTKRNASKEVLLNKSLLTNDITSPVGPTLNESGIGNQQPKLADVEAFFATLTKDKPKEKAAEWWIDRFGDDFAGRDWKRTASAWCLDASSRKAEAP